MPKLYVFPGQGSQFIGMGKELFKKFPEMVKNADEILGYSIQELCLQDPDNKLNLTQFTQPALFIVTVLSYLDKIAMEGKNFDFLAGHSLGEYAALFAADAFDFETGLKTVKKRGELMSKAPKGAMAAVLGMKISDISTILSESSFDNIDLANINTDAQIVLSGDYDEIHSAEKLFTQTGAQFHPLKVSAGFHSRLMNNVAIEFFDYLKEFTFSPLQCDVISNTTARPYPKKDYLHLLKEQIDHSVKWYESISWALTNECEEVEEVGPGFVLTKMVNTIKSNPMRMDIKDTLSTSGNIKLTKDTIRTFMFAGQGSQFKNMGRELYSSNLTFRKHLDYCSELVLRKTGISIISQLYHSRSSKQFVDVRITHPSIVSFEYSLAQVLIEEGILPAAVIGHSLGEYVAAVIAGSLTIEDAIDLVIKQSELVYDESNVGRMMVILDQVELFTSEPNLFNEVFFAGKNYDKSFVVSGAHKAIDLCAEKLSKCSISHKVLPVNIAFHSPIIHGVKDAFIEYANKIAFSQASIPVYSSCTQACSELASAQHLWNVVAEPMGFLDAIIKINDKNMIFIDVSPGGSLSLFLKHGMDDEVAQISLLNQHGHDQKSMERAVELLKPHHWVRDV